MNEFLPISTLEMSSPDYDFLREVKAHIDINYLTFTETTQVLEAHIHLILMLSPE
jgi:hypothetical protein